MQWYFFLYPKIHSHFDHGFLKIEQIIGYSILISTQLYKSFLLMSTVKIHGLHSWKILCIWSYAYMLKLLRLNTRVK